MCFTLFLNRPTFLSFPCCAHRSLPHVCVSHAALQIITTAFSIFHICVNIQYSFFSSDLFHFVEQALTLVRMATIETIHAGEDVEGKGTSCTADGNVN